jgi:hypothetical protein
VGTIPRRARLLHGIEEDRMEHLTELRRLAAWYRELADRAVDADARNDRLRAAAMLEREADFTERAFTGHLAESPAAGELQTAG